MGVQRGKNEERNREPQMVTERVQYSFVSHIPVSFALTVTPAACSIRFYCNSDFYVYTSYRELPNDVAMPQEYLEMLF